MNLAFSRLFYAKILTTIQIAVVIHWSRQLKDVLNSQDMSGLDETAGPLEEIDFWKARNQDLMGISKQLNKPSVKRITKVLDMAKSSYVSSFVKLAKQIQVNILI